MRLFVAIIGKYLAFGFGQAAQDERVLVAEGLLDVKVIGFFEFGQVRREVAFGQAGCALPKDEVGAFGGLNGDDEAW